MAEVNRCDYRIECKIRDWGEPSKFEERKGDPRSILTANISMEGEGAKTCLINLVKGMLDVDPKVKGSRDMLKYLEDAIIEDEKKEKTTVNPELIAAARKVGYDMHPTITIKVYRVR